MTTRVPIAYRARALSLLGGAYRLGQFIGPFAAAGLLAVTGNAHTGIWLLAALLVGVVLLVLFGPDPETQRETRQSAVAEARISEDTGDAMTEGLPTIEATRRPGLFRVIWQNRIVLSRLGLAAASLAAVRSAKQIVLPVVGLTLGLDASQISLVVGIAGAVEFALFYASGQVMDRFGRLWSALPSMLLMGLGFLSLAIVLWIGGGQLWFPALAVVIGVGNGLSAGTLLTIGADTAPQDDPAAYLGAWRTLTDGGGALTPILFSALTALFSLAAATSVVGVLGLLGALAFLRWVPRFVPRTERS
jgi:MFS family permease